jgi:hypothetical protein
MSMIAADLVPRLMIARIQSCRDVSCGPFLDGHFRRRTAAPFPQSPPALKIGSEETCQVVQQLGFRETPDRPTDLSELMPFAIR